MNPADLNLNRNDGLLNLETTPTSNGALKSKSATVLRIDTEPIYTQLRANLGEHFAEYKSALGAFFLGKLNRNELDRTLARFLSSAPSVASLTTPLYLQSSLQSTTHLHNTLLSAILANVHYRDSPPEPVASWVLATDTSPAANGLKPPTTSSAGDKVDERNKREVMALSVRDRRRIKSVKDGEKDTIATDIERYRESMEAVPSSAAGGAKNATTATASSLSKTNFDLEIKRRFALPLAAETCEFPLRADIQSRIEPIAFEEGLGGGVASGSLSACAELVETAAEMYVKEVLAALFSVSRSNGEGMVQTRRYRKQLRREEQMEDHGEMQRNNLGLLPVEADAVTRREPLAIEDLRLAVRLDGGRMRDRFLADKILGDTHMDLDVNERNTETLDLRVNGHAKPEREDADAMDIDGGDWGWEGAGMNERSALMDVLAGALAVGGS
ncbi:hypothetical protein MBLNU457_7441t3 [Dothideomycetes sp. NU457]